MTKRFYVTTTAPYVNAEPHIGFALEIIQADALARYHRLLGDQVAFGFGTDEHGVKIYRKALEEKLEPQKYCDKSVATWNQLKKALNLSYTQFIRTTEPRHIKAAQELWRRCLKNGDIYKKFYKIKYCSGCELEKTDSELENNHCPLHPNLPLDIIEEENYFFKFSQYQKPLLDFYNQHPDFVIPESRFQEIKAFVKNGLQDFSLSRLTSKMPWGVPVPDDPEQVMYVWFDALTFYISNLGWPENKKTFTEFWPVVQLAGKDNLRQQSAIWQAMLMSAGLPNSKQIFIHGFMTKDGKKISKSLGNTVDPLELTRKYGTDAVRYYLLAKIHPFNDSDFTYKDFETTYNADLANGLGNLVARITTLAEKFTKGKIPEAKNPYEDKKQIPLVKMELETWKKYNQYLNKYEFNLSLVAVWDFLRFVDQYITQEQPWVLVNKDQKKLNQVIYNLIDCLHQISWMIYPFLPQTAQEIAKRISARALLVENPDIKKSYQPLPIGSKINSGESLFPRR